MLTNKRAATYNSKSIDSFRSDFQGERESVLSLLEFDEQDYSISKQFGGDSGGGGLNMTT